jgi:hypothetical protein
MGSDFPRDARVDLLDLPPRLNSDSKRHGDTETPEARLAPLVAAGVFEATDYQPLDTEFRMCHSDIERLFAWLIKHLPGDFGYLPNRQYYGWRKMKKKILIQLGSEHDRGFKKAIQDLFDEWNDTTPTDDRLAIHDLLRDFIIELKRLRDLLEKKFQMDEEYTHLMIYESSSGRTNEHRDWNLVTRRAMRALFFARGSRRRIDFTLGNVRRNGDLEVRGARVCGSTYGSILLTSKLAGGNIALRRELVDFRESDPDSPAHALAAEAAFCHTALPEGPAVSVMMSGKAISRPPAAKRRRDH